MHILAVRVAACCRNLIVILNSCIHKGDYLIPRRSDFTGGWTDGQWRDHPRILARFTLQFLIPPMRLTHAIHYIELTTTSHVERTCTVDRSKQTPKNWCGCVVDRRRPKSEALIRRCFLCPSAAASAPWSGESELLVITDALCRGNSCSSSRAVMTSFSPKLWQIVASVVCGPVDD